MFSRDNSSNRRSTESKYSGLSTALATIGRFASNLPATTRRFCASRQVVHHRLRARSTSTLAAAQKIAKRGHYGAWLSDEPQLQQQRVGTLHCHLDCPVTVKIRVQEAGHSATVDYARMLQGAGASVIAVHGRTREQKGHAQGSADWDAIAAVKSAVSVPVLANGGIFAAADVTRCLEATKADGVMAGEALLENPALFEGNVCGTSQCALAREYLDLQADYPADLRSSSSIYSRWFTRACTSAHRPAPGAPQGEDAEDMSIVIDECAARAEGRSSAGEDVVDQRRSVFCCEASDAYTSWYRRHHWEAERHAIKQREKAAAAAAAAAAAEPTAVRQPQRRRR